MRAIVFVLVLAGWFIPAMAHASMPGGVGPVSAPETDPGILAIRVLQQDALARGDRAELKRLEGEVQAIHLAQQAPVRPCGITVETVLPGPRLPGMDVPDAEIDTGSFTATGADYSMDGTMYVAALRMSDTTNWFYRSTDHGATWQILIGYRFNSGGPRLISKRLGLCVGEGDSAFLHLFISFGSPNDQLYLLRTGLNGPGGQLYTVLPAPDTTTDFAVCRDYTGSNYWLYAVAVNDLRVGSRNARYLRSNNYGISWAITDSGSFDLHPHYSFGAGSWLYHALEGPDAVAKGEVWLFYNRVYGAHGQWQAQILAKDTFPVRDPVIAPAFTLPESTAATWTLFSHAYQGTGDWDMLFAWSTSGGRSWVDWGSLSVDTDSLERFADLRNYTSLGNTYVNGSYIWESNGQRKVLRHFSSSATPQTWSDTAQINTHSAGTGRAIRPLIIYSPGGPGSGGGCVFVGAGLRNLYFNSPWLTALAEAGKPGIVRGPRSLVCRGALDWPGKTPARLFDATGRPVALVTPGVNDLRKMPAGVYQALASDGSVSLRVVIAR